MRFAIGSLVVLANERGPDRFEGTYAFGKGEPVALAMERLPESSLATRRLNVPKLGKHSRLDVVYLGAEDCHFCRQWEFGSRQKLLESPQARAFAFHEVKNASLTKPMAAADYAPDLQWVYKQVGATRGVPRFLLAIDGKVMLNSFGTGEYKRTFLPALDKVVHDSAREGAREVQR